MELPPFRPMRHMRARPLPDLPLSITCTHRQLWEGHPQVNFRTRSLNLSGTLSQTNGNYPRVEQVADHTGGQSGGEDDNSNIPLERKRVTIKLGRGGTASSMTSSHQNVKYNGVKGPYGYLHGRAQGYARVPAGPPKKRLVLGTAPEKARRR
jgi:hypothetical protein